MDVRQRIRPIPAQRGDINGPPMWMQKIKLMAYTHAPWPPGRKLGRSSKVHCPKCAGCTPKRCWNKSNEHVHCLRHHIPAG